MRMLVPPDTWQSTGLYASAGSVITIEVPENSGQLDIQVGAHTDKLGHLLSWERAPIVALRDSLKPGVNQISSPFGGLIYLIPTRSEKAKTETVTISGAIRAPYFILGETDIDKWNETIKHYPAPWAELRGEQVIHTLPSSIIKELDRPDQVMQKWDDMVEQYNKLVGLTQDGSLPHRSPDRPHRYTADIQISAGYMHAGYPIMIPIIPQLPRRLTSLKFNPLKVGILARDGS